MGTTDDSRALRFDMQRDLVCTADEHGHFTSLNAAWERALGWTREELMQRPFIELVHPDDRERTAAESAQVALPDYELVDFENRFRTRAGGWRWLRWHARSDGTTWFAVAFDVTAEKESERRLRLALTEERLLPFSQPIMERRSRRISQEELLVRMRVGEDGTEVLPPSEFLADAERFGLIGLIDRLMIDQGIALAAQGRHPEINLSTQSLNDADLAGWVEERIRSSEARPGNMIFEVTETAALEHLDAATEFAERMVGLGCRFALDDFGTGYGSLTDLRRLPVQLIKIDISFVREVARNPADRALVRAIVAIARELRLSTVAEGVEEEAVLAKLDEDGVDFLQGFLIGRPRPVSE